MVVWKKLNLVNIRWFGVSMKFHSLAASKDPREKWWTREKNPASEFGAKGLQGQTVSFREGTTCHMIFIRKLSQLFSYCFIFYISCMYQATHFNLIIQYSLYKKKHDSWMSQCQSTKNLARTYTHRKTNGWNLKMMGSPKETLPKEN